MAYLTAEFLSERHMKGRLVSAGHKTTESPEGDSVVVNYENVTIFRIVNKPWSGSQAMKPKMSDRATVLKMVS